MKNNQSSFFDNNKGEVKKGEVKELWQMNRLEFFGEGDSDVGSKKYCSWSQQKIRNKTKFHKKIIESAFAEGKHIPDEVLSNYSDLNLVRKNKEEKMLGLLIGVGASVGVGVDLKIVNLIPIAGDYKNQLLEKFSEKTKFFSKEDEKNILANSYSAAKEFACGKESVGLADLDEPRSYGGVILGVTPRHVVQNLGMSAVIHLQDDLSRVPKQGELVNIAYVNGLGMVEPRGKVQARER